MGYFEIGDDEKAVLKDVEENGRLTSQQELILYNITLRQEELGRESTNLMLKKVKDDPVYQPMIDREFLTYEVFNYGTDGEHAICSLYVTLKGLRYCIIFGDEIAPNRKLNPAGGAWDYKREDDPYYQQLKAEGREAEFAGF